MNTIKVVENGVQAKRVMEELVRQGYTKDDIYLLAHDKDRSEDLTEALDLKEIGVFEQGMLDSIANVFRTRGEELRSKLQSLGLSEEEAALYEKDMDLGKVVVVAAKSA